MRLKSRGHAKTRSGGVQEEQGPPQPSDSDYVRLEENDDSQSRSCTARFMNCADGMAREGAAGADVAAAEDRRRAHRPYFVLRVRLTRIPTSLVTPLRTLSPDRRLRHGKYPYARLFHNQGNGIDAATPIR
jgi:hypothetical protein